MLYTQLCPRFRLGGLKEKCGSCRSAEEYSIPFYEQALLLQTTKEQAGAGDRALPKPPAARPKPPAAAQPQPEPPAAAAAAMMSQKEQPADGLGATDSMWSDDEEGAGEDLLGSKGHGSGELGVNQQPQPETARDATAPAVFGGVASAQNDSIAAGVAQPPADEDNANVHYYYQAADGQMIFLNPLDMRW